MARGKKRGKNYQGSVSKRPDGRFNAELPIRTPGGTKYARTTKKTEEEAYAWLNLKRHERDSGSLLDFDAEKLTLAGFLTRWLEFSVKNSVKPSSLVTYRWAVNKHISPALGHHKLSKLSAAHIEGFHSEKLSEGISEASVVLMHRVLRRSLGIARKWRLVTYNVAEDASPPKYRPPERAVLSLAEVSKLQEVMEGHPLKAIVHVALKTGMRQGELLALRWSDVDLDRGRLQVRRTGMYIADSGKNRMYFGTPKSGKSRGIGLGKKTVATLKAHRVQQQRSRLQSAVWEDHDLVFPNGHGKLQSRDTLLKHFQKLLREAGVTRISFHDLRHTAGTIMAESGESLKVIQQILGHSSIQQTADRYLHVSESMQQGTADRLDELF